MMSRQPVETARFDTGAKSSRRKPGKMSPGANFSLAHRCDGFFLFVVSEYIEEKDRTMVEQRDT